MRKRNEKAAVILLVEDDPGDQELTRRALEEGKIRNELHIVDPAKTLPTAYPIATYTYIILPTKSAKAAELRKMVFWALTQGQSPKYTAKLWFAAIPKRVLAASEKTLKQVTTAT